MDGKGLLIYILYGHGVIFVPLVHCVIYEYHFINISMTWSDAQLYCRENFTDLATIEREEDLSKIAIPAGVFAWIGLHDDPAAWKRAMTADHNSWRWSTTGTTSPGGFQTWALSEPNFSYGKETCVFMQNSKWKDLACGGKAYCICYEAQSGVKQFFVVNDTTRTWPQCQSVCRQDYQDVAMIENLDENKAASVAMIEGQVDTAWIGLYREPWVWSDRSNSTFRKWAPKVVEFKSKLCVHMDANGAMLDYQCFNLLPFVCHKVIKMSSEFRTNMRFQTKGDLSEAAIREQLIQLVQEKLKERNPEAKFKLQWIKEPTKEGNLQINATYLSPIECCCRP